MATEDAYQVSTSRRFLGNSAWEMDPEIRQLLGLWVPSCRGFMYTLEFQVILYSTFVRLVGCQRVWIRALRSMCIFGEAWSQTCAVYIFWTRTLAHCIVRHALLSGHSYKSSSYHEMWTSLMEKNTRRTSFVHQWKQHSTCRHNPAAAWIHVYSFMNPTTLGPLFNVKKQYKTWNCHKYSKCYNVFTDDLGPGTVCRETSPWSWHFKPVCEHACMLQASSVHSPLPTGHTEDIPSGLAEGGGVGTSEIIEGGVPSGTAQHTGV